MQASQVLNTWSGIGAMMVRLCFRVKWNTALPRRLIRRPPRRQAHTNKGGLENSAKNADRDVSGLRDLCEHYAELLDDSFMATVVTGRMQ